MAGLLVTFESFDSILVILNLGIERANRGGMGTLAHFVRR